MTNLIHLIIDGNAVEISVPEGASVVIRTNVMVRLELATPEFPSAVAYPTELVTPQNTNPLQLTIEDAAIIWPINPVHERNIGIYCLMCCEYVNDESHGELHTNQDRWRGSWCPDCRDYH